MGRERQERLQEQIWCRAGVSIIKRTVQCGRVTEEKLWQSRRPKLESRTEIQVGSGERKSEKPSLANETR